MAVGKNSLNFIALAARWGWNDVNIRKMYDHALRSNYLSGNDMRKALLKSEIWLINGLADKWRRIG